MKGICAFACILGLTSALVVNGPKVSALEMTGRMAAINVSPTSMSMNESANHTSDVFFGSNSKGPYTLSWKPINKFSDRVTIDGRDLQRGIDYELDTSSGTITFTENAGTTNVLRVEYGCNFTTATRNKDAVRMPVQLDLLAKSDASLKFTATYAQDASATGTAASGFTAYGLTGSTKTSLGNISTMFLTTPVSSDSDGQNTPSASDRSALKLASATNSGILQLDTSYMHVGRNFDAAKDYSLKQGTDALSIAAVLSPTKGLSLASSIKRSDALSGDNQGQVDTTSVNKLSYSTDSGSNLSLVRTSVSNENSGTVDKSTTTDHMQVEHKIGSSLSALASRDVVNAKDSSTSSRSTTDRILISANPTDKLSMSTEYVQKDSSTDGGQQAVNVNVDASPSKILNVKAAVSRTDSDSDGKNNTESFAISAKPNSNVALNMNLAHEDSTENGAELSHKVSLVTKPRDDTKIEVALAGKTSDSLGDESSHGMKVSTTAIKNTTLHANWSEKNSTVTGDEESSGISVEANPVSAVKLSGAFAQKDTATSRAVTKQAKLELNPFSGTKVAGAYNEVTQDTGLVSRCTEVNASSQLVKFLALSGGYKNRLSMADDDPDSMNVALKLDPIKYISFTGAYSSNPEDNQGIVQRLNSRSFGMRTDLGKLSVRGAYTLKEEYLAGRQSQMTEVGADYRFSPRTMLTTTYSLEESAQDSALQTYIYALTFTQKLGTRLNVYIAGKTKFAESDQVALDDQSEYEYEARLGLKF